LVGSHVAISPAALCLFLLLADRTSDSFSPHSELIPHPSSVFRFKLGGQSFGISGLIPGDVHVKILAPKEAIRPWQVDDMFTKLWLVAAAVFVVAVLEPRRSWSGARQVDAGRSTIDATTLSSGAPRWAVYPPHDHFDLPRRAKARKPRPFDLGA
jgi:hypothetical protein